MDKWQVDRDLCKGCELCVEFCRRGALKVTDELNIVGYYVPKLTDSTACNGCGVCAEMCPEVAIKVYRKKRTPKKKATEETKDA